MNNLFDEENF